MAGNVIYRGPIKDEPETVSDKTVAGAYLPGILVTESASALTVATGANIEDDLLVLSNRRFYGQDVATAYASGDTGVAYRPRPGEIYQVRVAATTYAKSDPLTVGASGYLEDAAAGERVLAFFEDTPGAYSAGDLADVRIANSFNIAAV
ncbi:hypothetical protein [uncultured Hyphomonas sp.]|uniref:hypothetical protein n=1 Tax=uncultured Hyphomonas sp. TaxID=225298 RepID=UPI000C5FBE78|nr:hypothetical protein [Hyphomonadaceae bacterium]MBA30099.1 hypothetical protein [Hyphomonadaceae bacterium]QDP63717.1 MAG: hypothetical protein GOVbin258_45 [Prokaryotic dsDNA virus sp.]|tara:strand:- start:20009 stop:20455 length:447 start_codon:yes stop_codon:yes gene_type:complete